jgi:hypothetical protein
MAAPHRRTDQLRPHTADCPSHPRLQPGPRGLSDVVLLVGLAHLVLSGHHRARLDPGPLDPQDPLGHRPGLLRAAAFTVINENYDYYPTLSRLLGKNAANFTDLPQLKAIRDEVRRSGKLPTHGETIAVTIPATVSKFDTEQAYVYLPPVWFKNPEPQLSMIELIDGVR